MSASRREDSAARLERALELFLQHEDAGGGDAGGLLAANEDLRELLEPMLGSTALAVPAGAVPLASAIGDTVIGDFRLVRELGRGGMGIVYEAWQRSLDRRVALKVLSPALVADASAVARFRREAAAVAKLHHPGIVEVFGFGSDGDRHWFAMALVDGEPLNRCRTRFRAPDAAVGLIAQVVDALQHAHAAGLVHRDVKPGNVIVRADGSAVLTDFGLACDAELPSMTAAGDFLGTLDYASPEQVQGDDVDARTDVWSAGVMLCELLTGERPFSRPSAAATMKSILTDDAPDVRRGNADASADLAAVVGHALERDRARRYPSAVAFLADLRALQTGGSVSARASTAGERVVKWARREPWRAVAMAVVLLAVPAMTAVLGYLWANAPRIAAAAAAEMAAAREEALGQAWLCIGEEDWEAALSALAVIGDAPLDSDVAVTRSKALYGLNRADEARACLDRVPDSPVVVRVRRWLQQQSADLGDGAETPTDPFDCFVLGAIVYDRAFLAADPVPLYRRATQLFERAVALSPSPRVTYLCYLLRAASFVHDEAAMATADAAIERHFAASSSARMARAVAFVEQQPERAIPAIQEVLARSPSPRPYQLYNLGLAFEKLGKPDEAERQYRAAVAADPRLGRAWNNLGMLLRKKKDLQGAADALRAAVTAWPQHSKAWNNLGITLRALGQQDEAQKALVQAIKLAPDYAVAHYNLGNLQLAAKDVAAAIVSFQKAVAADPTYVLAQGNLGNALLAAGRKQDALLAFTRAEALAPKDLIPHYNVARTALELNLVELALPAAVKATEVAPTRADAWAILAEVLLSTTPVDAPRALAMAQKADQLAKGKEPQVRVVLARALDAGGDRAAAVAMLETLAKEPKVQQDGKLAATVAAMLAALRAAK